MPVARIVYALLLGMMFGVFFEYAVWLFIPLKEKRKRATMLGGLAIVMISQFTTNITPADQTLSLTNECIYFVAEVAGILLLAWGCKGTVWKGYAQMLESNLILNIIRTLWEGGLSGIMHCSPSVVTVNSFADYGNLVIQLVIYLLTILTMQFCLRKKLFGRIPYRIWELIIIISMSILVADIVLKLFGVNGLDAVNHFTVMYVECAIPAFAASFFFLSWSIRGKQRQNREMEKMLEKQFIFVLMMLSQFLLNIAPAESTLSLASESAAFAAEVGGILVLAWGSTESVWIGYAKVMECSLILNITRTVCEGGMSGLLHYSPSVAEINSFANYGNIVSQVIVYSITILMMQLCLHWKLIGRISCRIWEMVIIISMSILIVDIVLKIFGVNGMEAANHFIVTYLECVIPALSASIFFLSWSFTGKKRENRRLEEILEKQYAYYQNLRDYQLQIRELRHDLLNHIETLRCVKENQTDMDKESLTRYMKQLFDRLKIQI